MYVTSGIINALVIFMHFSEGLQFTSFDTLVHPHEQAEDSLVLVHVLFRHGNRTAQLNEAYPKDPYLNYTYYPFGRGQLTNAGKVKEYCIGKALRRRYDNFLGTYYYPKIVDAVSTDYNRTKASLLLVLASLFPPTGVEVWKFAFNWQPIPYNYLPEEKDKVLLGSSCPNYVKLKNEVENSQELQAECAKYHDVFNYISKYTGLNVTLLNQVYNLYFDLSTEEEFGLKLPEWTKEVWPDIITNLTIEEYYVQTKTRDLKAMASGYLVRKILEDTQTKIQNIKEKLGRKMYLYSAHENNIADMLILLDVFEPPQVPSYGSYLIFEVHNLNNIYGFKIYYQNYKDKNLQLLILPNCDEFCPLDRFISLYQDYLPSDELCGEPLEKDNKII